MARYKVTVGNKQFNLPPMEITHYFRLKENKEKQLKLLYWGNFIEYDFDTREFVFDTEQIVKTTTYFEILQEKIKASNFDFRRTKINENYFVEKGYAVINKDTVVAKIDVDYVEILIFKNQSKWKKQIFSSYRFNQFDNDIKSKQLRKIPI